MKRSIAKKVTWRVSLILFVAMAVLLASTYAVVYRVVYDESIRHAHAVLSVYSDLVVYEASRDGVPLDRAHASIPVRRGNYICEWYMVDYAYAYVPNVEEGTITYIGTAYRPELYEDTLRNHMIGYTADYTLSDKELAVWDGEQTFADLLLDNRLGHEIASIICVEDDFGNRVILGVDTAYEEVYGKITNTFLVVAAVILSVLLCIYAAVYRVVRRQVSEPAERISRMMNDFIRNGKKSGEKLAESGVLEYDGIAHAFNQMADNIDGYVEHISLLTREQEHQRTQMEIAAHIQRGFLPDGHYEGECCEICGLTAPAKDVGGDLYDYLKLDERHTMVAVADVSGKGITAALFMAATLMLVRQFARMGYSPGKILDETNKTLVMRNPELLFATMFVGIYDSETETLAFANAGHNPPYVTGRGLRKIEVPNNAPLGLFEDEVYGQSEEKIRAGETVLLYTDGACEAINRERVFYGTERLERETEKCGGCGAGETVDRLYASITGFADGAEQYDDITLLALTVRKQNREEKQQ